MRQPDSRSALRTVVGYGLMLAGTVAAFLLIRSYGNTLTAPPVYGPQSSSPSTTQQPDVLLHVLLALAAVIILGQVLARLFAYLSQPPVIGEVVAGILLGPSLLGPDVSAMILPPAAAPLLGAVAQLGIILYMFIIGLDLNAGLLKDRLHATVTTSHMSILVPFLLGSLLSLPLYTRLSSGDVPFTSFALFMGVAISITAFPVLARILTDLRMARSELGVMALGCASINDVTAWCLLAFVSGVAKAQLGQGLWVAAGTVIYMAIIFLIVRPFLGRISSQLKTETLARETTAIFLVALLLSSLASEFIGIHAAFGAFLLGAVIPHDSAVARSFSGQLETVITVLFLPAFFALTGMRTRIDLVSGLDQWLICGLIIVVATAGKFGGTLLGARLSGLGWREGAALGTLMNTRGLIELIVLNIGLEMGIISPALFAMMVLMALATTMVTSPVLRLLIQLPRPERAAG
ncbi:MAG TPA: cation:proton antiporter [Blastocatellia bacterium]|nr:cation:proton antiporter [Blastocatellia bacterium]